MEFPVYKNDGNPLADLARRQRQAVKSLGSKINSGVYKQARNRCFCNSIEENKGTVVAEKDMYGLPLKSILCRKTGLICSDSIFDEKSNNEFYIHEYRDLASFGVSISSYFDSQVERGKNFYRIFKENVKDVLDCTIAEIGCGAGGVLYPFLNNKNQCAGFDYNEEYLEYGKTRGLDLRWGNYKDVLEKDSADILILSHVMEHFLNPMQEIQDVIEIIKPNGFLIIEVPGVYFKYHSADTPLKHLQRAHVVNYFHRDFLNFFFKELGLEVYYGDERCTFILKKPAGWKRKADAHVQAGVFEEKAEEIKKYLVETQEAHQRNWKNRVSNVLVSLRVMKFVRGIINRIKRSQIGEPLC